MSYIKIPSAQINHLTDYSCQVCNRDFSNGDDNVLFHTKDGIVLVDPIHPECLQKWFDLLKTIGAELSCPCCKINITHVNGELVNDGSIEPALIPSDPNSSESSLDKLEKDAPLSPQRNSGSNETILGNNVIEEVTVAPSPSPSAEEFGALIKTTIAEGRVDALELLLSNPIEIYADDWYEAIKMAANFPHAQMVEMLLKNGPISDSTRDEAICLASSHWNPSIIRSLLESGPISAPARALALANASLIGCWESIVLLLAGNAEVSEYDRGVAVIIAASKGLRGITQLLLENGPISIEHRSAAVFHAARNNKLHIIQTLLANGEEIHPPARGEAVAFAVKNRSPELVQEFAANGAIPYNFLGASLALAAYHGDLRSVQILLQRDIPIGFRGWAVQVALNGSRSQNQIIELLVQGVGIDDNYRGHAIKIFVEDGDLYMLRVLLQSGTISYEDRNEAIKIARESGREDMAQELVETAKFSGDDAMVFSFFA